MSYSFSDEVTFEILKGLTFTEVFQIEVNGQDEIHFILANGHKVVMTHINGCCESVTVESIVGDLQDLVGTPILLAEEVTHDNENPDGIDVPEEQEFQDSFTWTFYKLATIKGYVDIRWYGASNGYYSEAVRTYLLKE